MQDLKICLKRMQVTKQCIQQDSYFIGKKFACKKRVKVMSQGIIRKIYTYANKLINKPQR